MHAIPFMGLHEPVSSLTHLVAAVATLYGGWKLILKTRGDGYRVGASLLYVGCVLFLFSMSGVYHSLPPGPWREFFRRLDYMAIWLVVAGSATPIHILLMRGFWRWTLLALFWGACLSCLVLVDVLHKNMTYGAIVALYMAVSSIGIVSLYRLQRRFKLRTLAAVALGCLFYAVGALIDALNAPVLIPGVLGSHELFHLFVIAGAACHYVFIYGWADLRMRKVRVVAALPGENAWRTSPFVA